MGLSREERKQLEAQRMSAIGGLLVDAVAAPATPDTTPAVVAPDERLGEGEPARPEETAGVELTPARGDRGEDPAGSRAGAVVEKRAQKPRRRTESRVTAERASESTVAPFRPSTGVVALNQRSLGAAYRIATPVDEPILLALRRIALALGYGAGRETSPLAIVALELLIEELERLGARDEAALADRLREIHARRRPSVRRQQYMTHDERLLGRLDALLGVIDGPSRASLMREALELAVGGDQTPSRRRAFETRIGLGSASAAD